MGNNVAAGYAVAATPGAVGFQKSLEYTMYQYDLDPWDAKSFLAAKLQRQKELAKVSGLRFINVGDGLIYYGRHCGGWIERLTRERFVQLSMQLFRERGVMCPPEEAQLFYDIFDSIDLYGNAKLSIGELAGGLTSFFGGSLEKRTHAVFDLLDTGRSGKLSKHALQEFLKPYVYCMVPHDVLRPMFYSHVTNEITAEITGNDHISRDELVRWLRRNYSSDAFVTQSVPFSNVIVERAATIIERAVKMAHHENSHTRQLRSYGRESWEQSHPGQQQYLTDVGVVRYAANAAPTLSRGMASGPGTAAAETREPQPSLWSSVSQVTSWQMSLMSAQAGGYLSSLLGEEVDEDDEEEEQQLPLPAQSSGEQLHESTSFAASLVDPPPPEPPRPVAAPAAPQAPKALSGHPGIAPPPGPAMAMMAQAAQRSQHPSGASFAVHTSVMPAPAALQAGSVLQTARVH